MKVQVLRNSLIESVHDIDLLIVESSGRILYQSSDEALKRFIYPRSAIKMLQALPLAEQSVIEKARLSPVEVALACASHSGQPIHTTAVLGWLTRLNFKITDLLCGAHWPYDFDSKLELARDRLVPTALHNNCSGKHTGLLTLAQHLGSNPMQYDSWDHTVQVQLRRSISDICDFNFDIAQWSVDGCGIPTYYAPMERWALGLARFADRAATLGSNENQIYTSVRTNPVYTSGSNETSYRILEKYPNLIVKTGAEGIFIACIPYLKASVVIKVRDGNERASKPAMIWALDYLGIKSATEPMEFKIQNWSGKIVGELRVV